MGYDESDTNVSLLLSRFKSRGHRHENYKIACKWIAYK